MLDLQPRVLVEPGLHRLERLRRRQARDHRRVARPPERLHHLVDVAPDLGVEAGLAGVEHADDRPGPPGEATAAARARRRRTRAPPRRRRRSPTSPRGTSGPARSSPAGAARRPSPARRARRRCCAWSAGRSWAASSAPPPPSRPAPARPGRARPPARSRSAPPGRAGCRSAPRSGCPAGSRRRCRPSPVDTSVVFSPASSISTAANTKTTSAMPPAVSAVVSLRTQRLRAT